MKNLAKSAGLLFVAITALMSTSCTKQDEIPTKAVDTTTVPFTIAAEENPTGKIVDKNVVPVYVDKVQIWAKSNVDAALTVHEMFTFAAPGAGVQSGFSLDGVALGSNTFQAESWGKDSDKRLSLGPVGTSATTNVLEVMKAHTPYIDTFSNQPTVTITKTGNAPVAILMKTYNGRVLAKFAQEAPDATKYIATVSAKVPNGDYAAADESDTFTTLPETTITSNTGFEWSNANSRFTQGVVFTIKVYANNNGVKGALLNTITKEVPVAAATTKLCTFTVHNTDVETNIEAGGINLVFPTIGEEVIND